MAKSWHHSVLGLIAGVLLASGGISTAATPSVTYYACLKSGTLTAVGTKGPTCPKGAVKISWNSSGPEGPSGPAGVNGQPGRDGAQGIQGPAGPNGLNGLNGLQGIQGIQGLQGLQGLTGPVGPIGEKGETGPIGPKGDKGDKGEPGLGSTSIHPYVVGTDGSHYDVVTRDFQFNDLTVRQGQITYKAYDGGALLDESLSATFLTIDESWTPDQWGLSPWGAYTSSNCTTGQGVSFYLPVSGFSSSEVSLGYVWAMDDLQARQTSIFKLVRRTEYRDVRSVSDGNGGCETIDYSDSSALFAKFKAAYISNGNPKSDQYISARVAAVQSSPFDVVVFYGYAPRLLNTVVHYF